MKKYLFTSQLYIRQAVEYYEERGQSDTSTDSEDTVSDEEE